VKRLSIVLALITLLGCRTPEDTSTRLKDEEGVGPAFPTISSLTTPLPTSLDAFLRSLPDAMRRQFVILKDSRSVQAASPEHPRLVLFDSRGDQHFLALGVSTDPGDSHYEAVEIFEFDAATKTFHFHSLDFSTSPGVVSDRNPDECKGCHTTHLRPNWKPYQAWPEALGRNAVITDAERDEFRTNYLPRIGNTAVKRWSALLEPDYTGESPSAALNARLGPVIDAMIVQRIQKHPKFAESKTLILAGLLGCDIYVRDKLIAAGATTLAAWNLASNSIDNEVSKLPTETQADFKSAAFVPRGSKAALATAMAFGGLSGTTWLGQTFPGGHLRDRSGVLPPAAIKRIDPTFEAFLTEHALEPAICDKLPP